MASLKTLYHRAVFRVVSGEAEVPGDHTDRDQNFGYLILTHPGDNGRVTLRECRIGRDRKPVRQEGQAPNFQVSISAWVVFSSLNQVESGFRSLGQQIIDGHTTFVIGFAQIADSVKSPEVTLRASESVPMLLLGVPGIDREDFGIVRLRTDLWHHTVEGQTANILLDPCV